MCTFAPRALQLLDYLSRTANSKRFICEDAASSRLTRRRGHWLYQHTQIGFSGPEKDMLRNPINPRPPFFLQKHLIVYF